MSSQAAPTRLPIVERPYIGLRYFDERDAQVYYGRDEHVIELLGRLAENRFVAVLGSSASGKSSLVRAGLLPELRSGMIPQAGPLWKVVEFKPGRDPLGELSTALETALGIKGARQIVEEGPLGIVRAVQAAKLPERTNVLIIADQFEEVFRFQREEADQGRGAAAAEQCRALARRLLDAPTQTELGIYVLVVMRSEYLGECSQFPDLPERMSRSLYLTPRLRRDQLQEAITAPVGGNIEAAVVQRLLNESGSDPDQLPRLQHLLSRMWDLAQGGALGMQQYSDAGGWEGGLEKHLEEIYQKLSKAQQETCRRLFQQLSDLDKGQIVRRRAEIRDLERICGAETRTVVAKFRDAGFLFEQSAVVDVTHESVLRGWSKAKQWIREEVKARDFYSYLIRRRKMGGRLSSSEIRDVEKLRRDGTLTADWAARYGTAEDFTEVAQYVRSSKIKTRLFWAMLYAVIGLAVIALGLLGWETDQQKKDALAQAKKSAQQEEEARVRERAYAAMSGTDDPTRSLYLGLSAAGLSQLPSGFQAALTNDILKGPSFAVLPAGDVVSDTAWSPDGKVLASASFDKTIRLWDSANPQNIRTLSGHKERVRGVAWSPNGKMLASASDDKTIGLWDAATGQMTRTLTCQDAVLAVAFSPDGRTLASASDDKLIQLWDIPSGQVMQKLGNNTGVALRVAFSPDGKTLASAGEDKLIRLWDTASGNPTLTLRGHERSVNSVAFSPDGKMLASGSEDRTIRLWNATNGQALQTLSGHQSTVTSVAFSPDGKNVASASYDWTIRVWDVLAGAAIRTFNGHQSVATTVAWSSSGNMLASGSWDKTVRLWDPTAAEPLRTLSGHGDEVNNAAWSSDGKMLASVSDDKTIRLWNPANGQPIRSLAANPATSMLTAAFSPDGKRLASGSVDGVIRLWDVTNGQALSTLNSTRRQVNTIAWSPDGTMLASGGSDQIVRLWNAASGEMIRTLTGHKKLVSQVAWSPDGKLVASASWDTTIRVWEVATGKLLQTLTGHLTRVNSVAWSPDSKTVASAGSDETVRQWNAATGQLTRTLSGHQDAVFSVTWSPDGKTLASASGDFTIRLWDASNGQAIRTLIGHQRGVYSVAWNGAGDTIASASADGTIKLWPGNLQVLLNQVRERIRLVSLSKDDCEKYFQNANCPPIE